MARYFIALGYKGSAYSGFQVQQNAATIQGEVEKALAVYLRAPVALTGSSRTDTGVHAKQNFFHFDFEGLPQQDLKDIGYHLNAILPPDIVIYSIRKVRNDAHCRFDAIARSYRYSIYGIKNPFINDRSYYYPYPLDENLLNAAAVMLLQTVEFESFSKRNSQVGNYRCTLVKSEWIYEGEELVYRVEGNRFLRGMVRGMVGTMLQVGRRKLGLDAFKELIESRKRASADFSAPGHGLMLMEVKFPDGYFD